VVVMVCSSSSSSRSNIVAIVHILLISQ
jgi:hypothetical protein